MNALENKLYLALMGARTIVAATANVNPAALKILRLIDSAATDFKHVEKSEKRKAVAGPDDGPDEDEDDEDDEVSNAA